jgi:putative transposase
MPKYIRSQLAGATYFFTLTLAQRQSQLLTQNIALFRQAYQRANALHPFTTIAICVLPDHLHAIWQMPVDDGDFALRWRMIKSNFSRNFSVNQERSNSKIKHREKGIWQRRYWEHQIRDDVDLQRHVDYIHINPVKHGHVKQVKDWPYSTFHKYLAQGIYTENWGGFDDSGAFGE